MKDRQLPPGAVVRLERIRPPERQLKVAFFARTKKHTRVTAHFIRAFRRNGHRVLRIHGNKVLSYLGMWLGAAAILWRVRRFKPDMILIYHKDVPRRVLESLPPGIPKVLFWEDLEEPPNPEIVRIATECDHMFLTARGQIPFFQAQGVSRVYYLRTGCDEVDHRPVPPDPAFETDVSFIGRATGADRTSIVEAIARHHSVRVYGRGWERILRRKADRVEVYPEEFRRICSSSRITLGIDASDSVDLYFSNRTWLSLGCGAFLLTRYVPRLEELFTNHEHLVWFRTPDECLDLIQHYLSRPDERSRIAQAGCKYVHEYHTFRHAAAEMVARVFGDPWP